MGGQVVSHRKAFSQRQESALARHSLKIAAPAGLFALIVLATAKLVWHVPKPLLLVSGIIFLVCLALGILNRKATRSPHRQMAWIIVAWILAAALLLSSVYRWDRAGWIWLKLTGYNITLAEDFSGLVDLSTAAFIKQNPFFAIPPQDSTRLLLRKGEYDIHRTIVIPSGLSLTIEPGTVLRFRGGCSLISYGPIVARGSESEPILFTAHHEWRKWGVVGIVSEGKSIFEHVKFEHGRQALINTINFFGTLSFIKAEVEINHSQFVDLCGKDAVYVNEGRVFIRNNTFRDCFKDGLDLDGGAGEISYNRFINCGDEAIDLSADQRVQVFGNMVMASK